jgi:hypothetical protein
MTLDAILNLQTKILGIFGIAYVLYQGYNLIKYFSATQPSNHQNICQFCEKKGSTYVIVKGVKGIRKTNEWWDKECEQLKKETVRALREWKRTKINKNSLLEAKRR